MASCGITWKPVWMIDDPSTRDARKPGRTANVPTVAAGLIGLTCGWSVGGMTGNALVELLVGAAGCGGGVMAFTEYRQGVWPTSRRLALPTELAAIVERASLAAELWDETTRELVAGAFAEACWLAAVNDPDGRGGLCGRTRVVLEDLVGDVNHTDDPASLPAVSAALAWRRAHSEAIEDLSWSSPTRPIPLWKDHS